MVRMISIVGAVYALIGVLGYSMFKSDIKGKNWGIEHLIEFDPLWNVKGNDIDPLKEKTCDCLVRYWLIFFDWLSRQVLHFDPPSNCSKKSFWSTFEQLNILKSAKIISLEAHTHSCTDTDTHLYTYEHTSTNQQT